MSMTDANVPKMVKQPKEVSEPYDQNDDNQGVQNRFDLPLHRNKAVHEPQHDSDGDNCEKYGGKRHVIFSDSF
jgi:hypothetical protein